MKWVRDGGGRDMEVGEVRGQVGKTGMNVLWGV